MSFPKHLSNSIIKRTLSNLENRVDGDTTERISGDCDYLDENSLPWRFMPAFGTCTGIRNYADLYVQLRN